MLRPNAKISVITAVAAVLLLVLALIFFEIIDRKNDLSSVAVRGKEFSLEIADSGSERARGLGGRSELCRKCAMLFLFPEPGQYGFWMKDMKFSLDIIWIAGDKIIYLAKNIPADFKGTINPQKDADKVLEINGGLSDKYGIKEGDIVNFR